MTKSAYKFHPAAELFPLMNKAELEELAADIKKKGLIAEIVRDKDGLILEGRNRLEACRIAGVEPRFGKYLGNDPVGFIVSANIHRRHLTATQKRELVAKLLKLNPEKSDRQIAATAKVDHKTVAKERGKAVGRGEIPHQTKRTDARGRKQPAAKPVALKIASPPATPTRVTVQVVPADKLPKADPSATALAELKYAVDRYVPRLNADDLKKARAYFQDRAEAREKSNGARPTQSAEQSDEERRELHAKLAEAELKQSA